MAGPALGLAEGHDGIQIRPKAANKGTNKGATMGPSLAHAALAPDAAPISSLSCEPATARKDRFVIILVLHTDFRRRSITIASPHSVGRHAMRRSERPLREQSIGTGGAAPPQQGGPSHSYSAYLGRNPATANSQRGRSEDGTELRFLE